MGQAAGSSGAGSSGSLVASAGVGGGMGRHGGSSGGGAGSMQGTHGGCAAASVGGGHVHLLPISEECVLTPYGRYVWGVCIYDGRYDCAEGCMCVHERQGTSSTHTVKSSAAK